jgi:outer membrane protein OmpA-like peptidoglycan-associated protein
MELTTLISIAIAAVLAWPQPQDVAQQRIVLLPSADGSPSAVVVRGADGERLVNKPYASLEVMRSGTTKEVSLSESEVKERYAQLLDAQAPRPKSFSLYFASGSDSQLTPESAQTLAGLQTYLQSRPAPEVTVIGHTDRTGSAAINDALSLKRAQAVREQIRQAGIDADNIPVFGRGSREPIATSAQEGLNRRVEIHVR